MSALPGTFQRTEVKERCEDSQARVDGLELS